MHIRPLIIYFTRERCW